MRATNFFLIACSAALSAVLFWTSFSYFKAQEIEKAKARLTLYRSTLVAELRHFSHLPFLLSLDPVVTATLGGADPEALDYRLARFSQSAGIDAIFLMDGTGQTISASNAQTEASFKGQNYAFRPYFQEAQRGELGEFYGIGATTGQPGYFYAISVQNPENDGHGAIAIKIDLMALQESWQASGEQIVLANADGVVLLASDPSWRYRTLEPLSEIQREQIATARQFSDEKLVAFEWSADHVNQTAQVAGEQLLYLHTNELPNSWSLHFFVPDDVAVTRAWLTTGAFLVFVMVALIAIQLLRVRRIGAALRRSESEEAELRQTNDKLAREIDERRVAEQRLHKTQVELERAGRLAALGQLASSVTHELGQPIAAMRNQLVAAEITSGASPLTNKMEGLVARMENITRQLKFFSRKGRDKFEVVDVQDVMDDALELLEPTINHCDAVVTFERFGGSVLVKANRLRLEQVMTNIVRNALDAVEVEPIRQIRIVMGQDARHVWFTVQDTGHGLGGKTYDDLNEPFATTRESGRGMGLGLTISAGIVADHDGTISAEDREQGGAVFRIELPRAEEGTQT
ncbi:sensor histidine kinase [Phaeobacter sp. C3_T13_0]|uniref:sensor histidine kinase n=1 Tax=Phaeobacter cretensis TaxID=3342641 RepID=UPI0039BC4A28